MTAPFKKISTWRERIGQTADFPLHVPTDVERAMVAEIAELRAAQLAGNTAPGAPDARAKELAEALTIKYSPILITWDALIWVVKCLVKTLSERSATPPTADGAVPDERAAFEKAMSDMGQAVGYEGDGYYKYSSIRLAYDAWMVRAKLAAAPLPQVQSGALDDRSHWFKSWGGNEAEPMKLDPVVEANRAILLQRSQLGIKKYGDTLAAKRYSRRELLQHALEEALDLANYLQADIQGIDRAADQQPVTPSAALTDNSGEVKS
jgi:hypothetical protein